MGIRSACFKPERTERTRYGVWRSDERLEGAFRLLFRFQVLLQLSGDPYREAV